jgi:hypothetical protein
MYNFRLYFIPYRTLFFSVGLQRSCRGKNAIRSQPPNFSARAYYSGCISGIMYLYIKTSSDRSLWYWYDPCFVLPYYYVYYGTVIYWPPYLIFRLFVHIFVTECATQRNFVSKIPSHNTSSRVFNPMSTTAAPLAKNMP